MFISMSACAAIAIWELTKMMLQFNVEGRWWCWRLEMEDQRAKKEKRSLWIQEGGKEQTTERLHTIEHMNVEV
jgi:hypothetical protein